MSDLKIEWVFPDDLYERDVEGSSVSVVRLDQVDALIREMVWAMEMTSTYLEKALIRINAQPELIEANYQRAQDFLASPLVQAWRERHEEKR